MKKRMYEDPELDIRAFAIAGVLATTSAEPEDPDGEIVLPIDPFK